MDFKKFAISVKKELKNLGYDDMKLTHVQEAIARSKGYKSRHALLKELKEGKSEKPTTDEWNYYEVHVFQGRNDGYSVYFRAKEKWSTTLNEDDIIDRAIQLKLLEYDGDASDIDYVKNVDKDTWEWFAEPKTNIECQNCNQYVSKNHGKYQNEIFICNNCLDNQVTAYISTDDYQFDLVPFDIRFYLDECINDKSNDFIELFAEGHTSPGHETDYLYYNLQESNPVLNEISEYLNIVNNSRGLGRDPIGFSVSVDDNSFHKWYNVNKFKREAILRKK